MKCDVDDMILYEEQYIDNRKSVMEEGELKYITFATIIHVLKEVKDVRAQKLPTHRFF